MIAIDIYDWGETGPWPNDGKNLLQDEANLINDVVRGIDESFHLVGHSYGGTVCYFFSLTNPEKIKSLTLIEPMVCWLLNSSKNKKFFEEISDVARYFLQNYFAGTPEKGIEHYFDYWNGKGAWKKLDVSISDYVLAGAEKNCHEFDAILHGGMDLPKPENFSKPTLLIGGAESKPPPLRVIEILENCLPDSRSRLIDGAMHMSPITHGDIVNLEIKKFISM